MQQETSMKRHKIRHINTKSVSIDDSAEDYVQTNPCLKKL